MKINHSFQINFLLKMILIVFNFYLRKIVLQEVGGGGGESFECFCPIYRLFKKNIGGPGWLNEFGNNIAYSLRLSKLLF